MYYSTNAKNDDKEWPDNFVYRIRNVARALTRYVAIAITIRSY
jgi:hypothetical protein